MVKDSHIYNFCESFDDSAFINEVRTPNSKQSMSPDLWSQVQSLNDSPEIEFLDNHEPNSVLKFLDQILMEENVVEKPDILHDSQALLVTEKSFYDVIEIKYPPLTSNDENTESQTSLCEKTCKTNGSSADPSWSGHPECDDFPVGQVHPSNQSTESLVSSSQPLVHPVNSSMSNKEAQIGSFPNVHVVPSQFSDTESKLQFWRGVEEARKFLPNKIELVVDLDKYTLTPSKVARKEKDDSSSSRGRKHLHHQDSNLDARSRKQTTAYPDEVELSELFDNLFLRDLDGMVVTSKGDFQFLNTNDKGVETVSSKGDINYIKGIDKFMQLNRLPQLSRNGQFTNIKQGADSDDVHLQSLLLNCAEAAASGDLRDAHEQLKQIRQYAYSTGDALANVFANGLEARFFGSGAQMYAALASKRISSAEKLKAYQVYHLVCPFKELSANFVNQVILKIAAKSSTLHIVDFGISHGFQWPVFIQLLSVRHGGPPKLRITGIDFPQCLHPAESIEETGQILARHCKRFNIPFEYQIIAKQSLEKIQIKDLKLARNEVLVVNCMSQFHNLPEETVLEDSPKDGVLKLIRSMKPDLFVHSIENGSYNAPFFMTRFREALFHYASLFDMLDVLLPRNDPQRLHIENELYGAEVVNVIACEGKQRVVRPETYKQWHIRTTQAGFRIVPIDNSWVVSKGNILKGKVLADYHKDFLLVEDCNWMLQGWKGRVLSGSSCWVPV